MYITVTYIPGSSVSTKTEKKLPATMGLHTGIRKDEMNIDIKCNLCGEVMYQCGFRRDGVMAVDPCPCQKDLKERLASSLEQLACWARNNSRTGKWDSEEDIREMLAPVWDLIEEAFPEEEK